MGDVLERYNNCMKIFLMTFTLAASTLLAQRIIPPPWRVVPPPIVEFPPSPILELQAATVQCETPEPATYLMLGGGLLVGGFLKYARKKTDKENR